VIFDTLRRKEVKRKKEGEIKRKDGKTKRKKGSRSKF
jgi:hypothetical protein